MRISDWSSDVCSSDLATRPQGERKSHTCRSEVHAAQWRAPQRRVGPCEEPDAMTTVETLWPLGATLGEGALWNPADGCVWFVAIKAPAAPRRRWSDGATNSWPMPERAGFVGPRSARGL